MDDDNSDNANEPQIKHEDGDNAIEPQFKHEDGDNANEPQIKHEDGDYVNEPQIKHEDGDYANEPQIKQEDGDENKIYGKIWRAPVKKDGRPTFIMRCPMCDAITSDLVKHIKANHKDTDWRGIQTPCPFEDCEKVVVDIQNHIRLFHLKIKNFGCDLCDAKFSNRGQVKTHVNGVHLNIREKCPHCDTILKVTTMKMHIKNVHENGRQRVACTENDCTKTFLTKSDMNRHVASVHEKIKFACPDCGNFFHVDALAKHIKIKHKQIYPYSCKQCEKGFQVLTDLHMHIRTKHSVDFVLCNKLNSEGEMCGKKLRNEEALQKHVERIHLRIEDIKNPKVICPECGIKIFEENLQRHIDVVHLKITNKSCTVENCGEIFTSNYSLKRHVDKVHNKVISREWCDSCEEFKENLKAHIREMHMDRKSLSCTWSQCDYQSKNRSCLQKHIKNVHDEKLRVNCDECGKSVKDLYGHKKQTHRKPIDSYFCQECDKGFPQKHQLRDHINKIHLKVRCTCPKCGLDLAAGSLKSHMRFVHEKRIGAVCEERRHQEEIASLQATFKQKTDDLHTEINSLRELIEGKSDSIKLSDSAVENAVKHVATEEFKKLKSDVTSANVKNNSLEQYTRSWCLRVYGVSVSETREAEVGPVKAAMEAVYAAIVRPVLEKVVNNGGHGLSNVPGLEDCIENCHKLGKSIVKKGKTFPPVGK